MCSVHPITATETAGHDEMAVYILPPSQEASGVCTASEAHRRSHSPPQANQTGRNDRSVNRSQNSLFDLLKFERQRAVLTSAFVIFHRIMLRRKRIAVIVAGVLDRK